MRPVKVVSPRTPTSPGPIKLPFHNELILIKVIKLTEAKSRTRQAEQGGEAYFNSIAPALPASPLPTSLRALPHDHLISQYQVFNLCNLRLYCCFRDYGESQFSRFLLEFKKTKMFFYMQKKNIVLLFIWIL